MRWLLFIETVCLGLCLVELRRLETNNVTIGLEAKLAQVRRCVMGLFDITIHAKKLKNATDARRVFVSNYNSEKEEAEKCVEANIPVVAQFLSEDEKRNYNDTVRALIKVADQFNENDGERVILFAENGGLECSGSYDNCPHFDPNYVLNAKTKMNCTDYRKFKDCVIATTQDNCSSNIPAIVIKDYFNFLERFLCTNDKIIRHKRSLRRIVRDLGMGGKLPHIKKKLMSACQEQEGKLNKSLDKMQECIDEKQIFTTPRDVYIAHLDLCSKPIIKELDDCLPEKLRYLPKFLFKLVDSVVRLLYDDFDEIAFGLGPCVSKLKTPESEQDYHACIHKVAETNDDEIPESKAEFCEKFLPITKCFTKQINDTCKHTPDLDKFSRDYIKAMEDPCNA